MAQIIVGNLNNVITTIAARAVITAHVARMYRSWPYVMFYLNFTDGWETATLSFYNEAEQDRWPVGSNEHCVGVTALGLVASRLAGDSGGCLIESMREVIRHESAADYNAQVNKTRRLLGLDELIGVCYSSGSDE